MERRKSSSEMAQFSKSVEEKHNWGQGITAHWGTLAGLDLAVGCPTSRPKAAHPTKMLASKRRFNPYANAKRPTGCRGLTVEAPEDDRLLSLVSGLSLTNPGTRRLDLRTERDYSVEEQLSLSSLSLNNREVGLDRATHKHVVIQSSKAAKKGVTYKMPGPDTCRWDGCNLPLRTGSHRSTEHFSNWPTNDIEWHCQWTGCKTQFLGNARAMMRHILTSH